MNLLLLHPDQLTAPDRALVRDRQLRHLTEVHRAQVGDQLMVGQVNGAIGSGRVESLNPVAAELSVEWHEQPPPPLPLTLVLALPRPKMLRRIIQSSVAMGVKKLVLINSYRVEKSYWQTPWLGEESLAEQITLGLEQARDTRWPQILQRPLFKPFVEDELDAMAGDSLRLIAHPGGDAPCPSAVSEPVTLCIGPEGGFIPYEVTLIEQQGFSAVHLGPRILRTETAIPALLGRLFDSTRINAN